MADALPSAGDLEPVRSQLAPAGRLRVALNLSNFLLVSGQSATGEWQGVAPDMARELAGVLGVELEFVPYRTPSELAAAADAGAWTVAFVGADPARAARIAFSDPYVQIEATYLVPPGSPLQNAAEVDRPGHTVVAFAGSAYDLWLLRHLKHAALVHADSFQGAFERFHSEGLTALASLKSALLKDRLQWPGSRILDGSFMQVHQSVGTQKHHEAGAAFLQVFVAHVKSTGQVHEWIVRHQAEGLSVSP